MKYTLCIMSLLSLFILTTVHSQQLSGEATYQTRTSIEMSMDSTSINSEMQKTIQEQLRKQFQKEYKLTFNNTESLWREEATLGKPQALSGVGIQVITTGNKDILYHNIKEEKYVNQSDLMGKLFLVSDTLSKLEWKLEKDVKNIGQYKCFKATLTQEYEVNSFGTGEDKVKKEKKTRTTTAWYTLDIPVQLGPSRYWGLPGLILEINDGKTTMMCTKVVLNKGKKVDVVIPEKGKKVTGDQFKTITEEKTKEMIERYQSKGSKKGENTSFSISIQG